MFSIDNLVGAMYMRVLSSFSFSMLAMSVLNFHVYKTFPPCMTAWLKYSYIHYIIILKRMVIYLCLHTSTWLVCLTQNVHVYR